MGNNTKKILILSRLNSHCIEKAIFILRDDTHVSSGDAVTEAQKIVDSYINNMDCQLSVHKKEHRLHPFTSGVLTSIAVIVSTFLIISILR